MISVLSARNLFMAAVVFMCILSGTFSHSIALDIVRVPDMAGRMVQVPRDPRRIVCVGPGTLRLIVYLEATDKVVGIEDMEKRSPSGRPYMLAYPDLMRLPTVGPGGPSAINREPDLEAVIKVRPDVLFVSYMEPANASALQKKLGIPVVVLTHGSFAAFDQLFYESLQVAGTILSKETRARQVKAFIENVRNDCCMRIAGIDEANGPSVYVGAVGYKGGQGIESTHGSYIPLEWVRARNVAKHLSANRHVFVDKEKLLEWDPDIVFIDGGGRLVMQDFARNPEFYRGLKAFRQKNVYLLHPFNNYVTNIDTAMTDAYAVGKILYPERFSDIILRRKADEIYSFLLGKPVYDTMVQTFGPLGRTVALPW